MKPARRHSFKPSGQLPPGNYWVGDLSYVVEDFFDRGYDRLEGVDATKDGYPLAIYHTAHGDGIFVDNDGDNYSVDTASIGCISLNAIEHTSDLGHCVHFANSFVCNWKDDGGLIGFGDLVIKTEVLSDAENSIPANKRTNGGGAGHESDSANLSTESGKGHVKLRICPHKRFADLILDEEADFDDEARLVIWEIASYIDDPYATFARSYSEESNRKHDMWRLHLVFHSDFAEFVEYFRGYYATPDNGTHEDNIEAGLTQTELYTFLECLDWRKIFNQCRRYATLDGVARIFRSVTGYDYAEERARYPVEPWDGTPRWAMENGKYLPSD